MNKEFNLSEKRKKLYHELKKQFEGIEHIDRILFVILNCVDEQDKEFIQKLKEGIADEDRYLGLGKGTGVLDINAFIDKLAGEELSK